MSRTIPFILACILLSYVNNSISADKYIQQTEGDQSPAVSIAGKNNTITIIYNSLDPITKKDYEKQIQNKEQELEKTKKSNQEQQEELEKYAITFKNIYDFIEREKNKPNGNIKLVTKIEKLLHGGKLDEANTLLQGVTLHLTAGEMKVSSTTRIQKNQTKEVFGDELLISVQSIEHSNSGQLVVNAIFDAPGKESKRQFSGVENACMSYAGFSIRVSSISNESADFTIPCE